MNYLDANASAKPVQAVLQAPPASAGNPSSAHRAGQLARARLEDAREVLAQHMGVHAGRLVFTSGGSESVMTALWSAPAHFTHLYHAATDHPVTRQSAALLARRGWRCVQILPTDRFAHPTLSDSAPVGPALVSLQVAHSELGTLLSPAWIAQHFGLAGSRGDLRLHLDCCQALGKVEITPYLELADLASFSAHKIGGPAGTGLLYIREGIGELDPLIPGEQEWRRRGGTENHTGIVGFAAAAQQRLKPSNMHAQTAHWQSLTTILRESLVREFPDTHLVSPSLERCLPQTTFVHIPGMRSNFAVIALDKRNIAVSAGTACRSGLVGANETALALGYSEQEASEMLRISFDWDTTQQQIEELITALRAIRTSLR